MLAAIHTAIAGWDVVFAVLAVIVAVVLDKFFQIEPGWVPASVLFFAALLTAAILISW